MSTVTLEVEVDLSSIELSDLEGELTRRQSTLSFSNLNDDDIAALAEKYHYAKGVEASAIAAAEYFDAVHGMKNLSL